MVNCILEKPFCISIVTGNEKDTGGTLTLSINDDVKFENKLFGRSDEVIKECFPNFDSIIVQNPTSNGWAGEIKVTNNGVEIELSCITNCIGRMFNGKIVVDGNRNTNAPDYETYCNDGDKCTLKRKGINVLF